MESRVRNGDIIIWLESLLEPKKYSPDEFKYQIAENSYHVMIYKDGKMYDAFSSRSEYDKIQRSGVSSHEWLSRRNPSPLGLNVVLRCEDEVISEKLATIVERWDGKRNIAKYKAETERARVEIKRQTRLGYEQPITPLVFPTPFSDSRSEDDNIIMAPKYDLYRAFRALMRNHTDPPLPLSKKKGVSCNQFAEYALKAAILSSIFSTESLEKIFSIIKLIEANKKANNFTKLSQLENEIFIQFEDMVKKELEDTNNNFKMWEKYEKFIYSSIKGKGAPDFCIDVLVNTPIVDLKGFYYYRNLGDEKDKNELWIMESDTLLNFLKFTGKISDPDSVSDLIPEELLNRFNKFVLSDTITLQTHSKFATSRIESELDDKIEIGKSNPDSLLPKS